MLSVIMDDTRDPARNLALDEALLRAAAPTPLVRVWQSEPCVIIGRFQRPAAAVDLAACAGIPVLRRASGGGAVLLGPGCLNITVVDECPRPSPGRALRLADTRLADLTAGFGIPLARTAALTARHRILVHATIQVTSCDASYLPTPYDTQSVDALRAALLAATVEWYGRAGTRGLTETELTCCEMLLTRRYKDLGWHLGSGRKGLVRVG